MTDTKETTEKPKKQRARRSPDAPPARVFKYGLPFGPRENADVVWQQMRSAHAYHNNLIQLELARRDALRLEIAKHPEEIAALDAEIKVHSVAIKNKKLPKDERENHKSLRADLYARRDEILGVPAMTEREVAMHKSLRKNCGVYWGTYLLMDAAAFQQRSGKDPPKFKRWYGEGRVGVQVQGGMSVDDLYRAEDPRVRLTPTYGRNAILSLRVQSDGKGKPVFATFPVVMHRPLPEDGRIKEVSVQAYHIGTRLRWEVCFVLEAKSFVTIPKPGNREVALNFGWREHATGFRVCTCTDSLGRSWEITLPESIQEAIDHAESLQSIRERAFNSARADLLAFAKSQETPEWFRARTRTAHAWKHHDKLTYLVYQWSRNRFPGDEAAYAAAEAWRRQERHLYQWEASERDRAHSHRNHVYRNIAADLARTYTRILIPDTDFAKLAKKVAQESPQDTSKRRFVSASGMFRSMVIHAGAKHGATVIKVSDENITRRCGSCRELVTGSMIPSAVYVCEHCGAEWDQDVNAGVNMSVKVAAAAE